MQFVLYIPTSLDKFLRTVTQNSTTTFIGKLQFRVVTNLAEGSGFKVTIE